jgi:hypothetical protein
LGSELDQQSKQIQIQIQIIFIVPYKIQHFILVEIQQIVHGGGTDKEKKGG